MRSARIALRNWIRRPAHKHRFARELPPRYRDSVDVRLFGPGERVVFLPYSKQVFEETQRWIHERDIFESAAVCDYQAAVIACLPRR